LSLYVHLPWCVRKCPYCDFNSHPAGAAPPLDRYVDALLRDLETESMRIGDRPVISVFLGGGTPSLFPAARIDRLLRRIRSRFNLVDDVEVTMEANPGAVERGQIAGYAEAGVNRLSLGAQSFTPSALQVLGRIHSVDDIGRAVAEARAAGIGNLNLDLMYALPGQALPAALHDLECAIELDPEHLSWYELTLEPNTAFHARPPAGLPDDEAVAAVERAGERLLEARGFRQYEVSAYAREGHRCRHNLNYWSFGDYVGVGAGAHGKLTADGQILRTLRAANPLTYMESVEAGRTVDSVAVAGDDRVFEFMLNALRLRDGFAEAEFEERTGVAAEKLAPQLAALRDERLIEEAGAGFWRVSSLGRRFLNDVQARFLP
jgi:oxygen-independent coproporphyrinogen-3 oxidase